MGGVMHHHNYQLESVLGMKGGDGEFSYAKNCSAQTNVLLSVRPMLEDAIKNMQCFPACKTFCVADLGCSSSHNSVIAMETVLQSAMKKKTGTSSSIPEFHVYFNDLPSNDFDALYRRLGPHFTYRGSPNTHKATNEAKVVALSTSQSSCFYSQVVGSFYRRLFPSNSLHFVHSSCSLHWLSKIPDAVRDGKSPSYNKWEAFIAKEGSYSVAKAYLQQFQSDLFEFLRARAEELVAGGVMFLVLPTRAASDPRQQGTLLSLCGQLLGAAFRHLIMQGLMEEEKLHSFNLPFFSPTVEEFKSIVRAEGSFSVQRCEVLQGESAGVPQDIGKMMQDRGLLGKNLSKQYRNGLEKVIAAHIGSDLTDKVFENVERRAVEIAEECIRLMKGLTHMVVVLVRR